MKNAPSRELGSSLHHQVAAVLRSGVVSGRYAVGSFLPGEPALTAMFGVSRATIRRALLSLEQEGLIDRQQGRGTQVTADGRRPDAPVSLSSHLDVVNPDDREYSVAVRSFELVAPTAAVRVALGSPDGERAWRLVRVRTRGGRPEWIMINHFPLAVGEKLRDAPFERTTIFNALKRAGYVFDRAEETIGATLADHETAAEIDVKVGAPLLELSRLMLDGEGAPIGHQLTLVPPERRKLRVIIQADAAGLPEAGMLAPLRPR
jgi:GntR family transcriptional regulator